MMRIVQVLYYEHNIVIRTVSQNRHNTQHNRHHVPGPFSAANNTILTPKMKMREDAAITVFRKVQILQTLF